MTIFNLDKNYSVECEFVDTRSGFKHIATLFKNGCEVSSKEVKYYNRTWEAWEYQTVLRELVCEHFDGAECKKYLTKIKESINGRF